ncbi:uncharacterized protein PV09_00232 [Verruconis gallopava]|uniref:Cyclin N-terminal domain-containing protein n=1 Tax=Verruconis gallopava TaxID=253628 RepID=A0A0D2ARJ9_9PEZI|nr:uncharacterized protein PV09_00232 [Verruconis gallopava]KIW09323.1 hypothetical protein PV09_00232 [Verruconis gallopava]
MTVDRRLPAAISVTPSTCPYHSSLSSSASSSSSSVFSVDTASQLSETSACSLRSHGSDRIKWDTEDPWRSSQCRDEVPQTVRRALPPIKTSEVPIASEHRQHPRRCSVSAQRPPTLIRQSERKGQFVECLVDSATQMVEVIWPLSVPHCPSESGRSGVLPLRTFIQETLRRSRTSFSTLQVALYYLILIKSHVPKYDFTMEQRDDSLSSRALQCGRRMFLAALILASKYLQDRNYSARAWSRISGLKTEEINTNEMAFLKAVNWKLHVPEGLFERWQDILIKYTSHQPPTPGSSLLSMCFDWKSIVPHLTPALDTVDIAPRGQFNLAHLEPRKASPVTPRFVDLIGSNDTTPTPQSPLTGLAGIPRVLEPIPNMLPPTPSLNRMGPLPTPILTPPVVSSTPAVSVAGYNSRRPSISSAMSQLQNACVARSTVDYNWSNKPYHGLETYQLSGRRPSLQSISGSSLTSSPESMISDNSSVSRSSRASSISSASSLCSANACAPTSVKLNRLATLRCAGLPCPMLTSQALPTHREPGTDYYGSYTIKPLMNESMSSPDVEELKLSDEVPTVLPIRQREQQQDSPSKGRKRGRSSVDLSLHQNVREFLGSNARSYLADPITCIISDSATAEPSVFLQSPCPSGMKTPTCPEYTAKALQSPARSIPERRLPIQKDLGRKRACCASEAGNVMSFTGGPGMWSGIL